MDDPRETPRLWSWDIDTGRRAHAMRQASERTSLIEINAQANVWNTPLGLVTRPKDEPDRNEVMVAANAISAFDAATWETDRLLVITEGRAIRDEIARAISNRLVVRRTSILSAMDLMVEVVRRNAATFGYPATPEVYETDTDRLRVLRAIVTPASGKTPTERRLRDLDQAVGVCLWADAPSEPPPPETELAGRYIDEMRERRVIDERLAMFYLRRLNHTANRLGFSPFERCLVVGNTTRAIADELVMRLTAGQPARSTAYNAKEHQPRPQASHSPAHSGA